MSRKEHITAIPIVRALAMIGVISVHSTSQATVDMVDLAALPGAKENQLRLKQLLMHRDVVGYRAQASLLGLDAGRLDPLKALL
ncbi:hypothetical protein [Paenibacillus popilliae]|uniref:DNA uptake protein n=1 Tax=Paenibacillus popilliae ATCC 14706 TaxID=1212764 RepID=M9L808_PAEPP|nr:hypothetical protein [Paenibacillus popilliae]GAC41192.1 DNA uptake protein [Paenibacillus popilliae ATCC 14706]